MDSSETGGEAFNAETLRYIKDTSREFFKEFFPKNKDSQKTFSEAEKLTGDFMAQRLKSIEAVGDDGVRLMANGRPVVNAVTAEWKSGGLFKKTQKGVFFVWHDGIKSPDAALTLAEFNAFLNANGLDGMTDVNWIGTAASNLDLGKLRRMVENAEPLFFANTDEWQTCDINYNLKSISYDAGSKSLVLKIEDRLFT